jgi:hypothetical protein
MHSNNLDQAHHSIHHVHELIQTLFTSQQGVGQAAISQLMPVFAKDFSMVTTTGTLVGREQVEQMFKGAVGARPGLQIFLTDLHTVWQEGASVAVRYKETHRLNGTEAARLSVAIMEVENQRVQWHYLHETALSPAAIPSQSASAQMR